MKKEFTNRLANETSPYLLQHAHNPVDWFPWGEEALTKAKKEDKPILVSIGYAACHWCHVMEHESFENEQVAGFMNENFVNIKIDREERPDIDHIYMDAVQAMTGSGGWPLNVFLTPDKKPFYGGTYFPPVQAYNRASWMEILSGVRKIFHEKREEIEKQGDSLTNHIAAQSFFERNKKGTDENEWSKALPEKAFQNLRTNFDHTEGGFGGAPKFPGTFCINFLLRYAHYTKNEDALNQAFLSLDKMSMGGIYDQLGGGFARYSTDSKWLVPHFEKMLYDNALLVSTLSDAYKISGKKIYADTLHQTLAFVQRELMPAPGTIGSEEGAFYASLDADSEGKEGKFYCWSKKEIDELLKEDSVLFCEFFGVTAEGNWEHTTILNQPVSMEEFSKKKNIPIENLERFLLEAKSILLEARGKRIRPGLDDKIILSWNGLMCSAFSAAYAAIGEKEFLRAAEKNMAFLVRSFRRSKEDWALFHNYKNGKGFNLALLDDYALLIQAMLDLYEVNFDRQLIFRANEITEYVLAHFYDDLDGLFYYSSDLQTDLLLRKKEFFDGAIPSGNSVMANNLRRLSLIVDNKRYGLIADTMLSSFSKLVVDYPSSFANWLSIITDGIEGTKEIVMVGPDYLKFAAEINSLFIPNGMRMASGQEDAAFPLLAGKGSVGQTLIFLCENYSCRMPVDSVSAFKTSSGLF